MNRSELQDREPIGPKDGEQRHGSIRTYDRWQLFYLDRLNRLFDLNKDAEAGLLDEEQVGLLRRAIFFTLLDCQLVGVGAEAQKVIAVEP